MDTNLKYFRKQRGLTQKEIAKILNIDYTTYGRYENGLTEPNLETLVNIAKILNTSVDNLLNNKLGDNTTSQEIELVDTFQQLPDLEQSMVLGYAKKTLESVKQAKEQELKNKLKQNK